MKKAFLIFSLIVGFVCVNAANVCNVSSVTSIKSTEDVYGIYCANNLDSGSTTLTASGGYAGATLVATYGTTTPTKFEWSATFSGECDRYYIWPTGGKADISIYLTGRQT